MKFSGLIIKFFFFLLLFSCTPKKSENEKIIIFHAGSLAVPFSEIIDAYNSENPEIELYAESSGSLQAARKITDLHKECDMLAVSDYLVIDNMMIPEFAEWNFPFCTNEMVIAYNANSFKANEITSENWISILNEEECIIGRSDPNADPCGYRSIFLFHLSESYYNEAGFAEKIINKANTVIRPKEVDLLALLETSNIDYLIIYKSVAIQHNLKYIQLPDELNLSNPEMEENYSTVFTIVNGSNPGEFVEIKGSSILYSFCIPKTAQNIKGAKSFARFLTDPEKGGKILHQHGMKLLTIDEIKLKLIE